MSEPKEFPLGRLVMTTNLEHTMKADDPEGWNDELVRLTARHATGDWGEVDKHDAGVNDRALVDGDRLLSAYTTSKGRKIWIITEWDRSVTTALLPEDY